jgi:hypothetical protein
MISQLAREHAQRWDAIRALTDDPRVRDGNPRSQARLEAKVKAAGGMQTFLTPGKKGTLLLAGIFLDRLEPGNRCANHGRG